MRISFTRAIGWGCCVALLASYCAAQTGNWAAVEGLAPGTAIEVSAGGKKLHGEFDYADPERLILWWDQRSFPGRVVVKREVARSEVRQVRVVYRTASVAAGAAIGAGIGAGIGVAVDSTAKNHEDRSLTAVVGGLLGAGLGAAIGKIHPFVKGSVIYRAP
jgi:hypothetical protein